jgi:hypothetical protein
LDDLTTDLWSKIVARLNGVYDEKRGASRYAVFDNCFQSAILTSFPPLLREFEFQKWTFLYRGTVDGFRATNFHSKCDGHANTVTVIQTTKGFIFSGFTPLAWDSSSGYQADNSRKSFLFSLKNSRNSETRKFVMANSAKAIYCGGTYGLVFGSKNDIQVGDSCNGNTRNYTDIGGTYVNDTGISGEQVFTGERVFTVKEIEVFSLAL